MSVTVIALLTPKPGMTAQVIESLREVSPLVHRESGREFYAGHPDGSVVFMVESWTTQEDLDAHATSAPLARHKGLNAELLLKLYDIWMLDNVSLDDPAFIVADRIGGTQAGWGP